MKLNMRLNNKYKQNDQRPEECINCNVNCLLINVMLDFLRRLKCCCQIICCVPLEKIFPCMRSSCETALHTKHHSAGKTPSSSSYHSGQQSLGKTPSSTSYQSHRQRVRGKDCVSRRSSNQGSGHKIRCIDKSCEQNKCYTSNENASYGKDGPKRKIKIKDEGEIKDQTKDTESKPILDRVVIKTSYRKENFEKTDKQSNTELYTRVDKITVLKKLDDIDKETNKAGNQEKVKDNKPIDIKSIGQYIDDKYMPQFRDNKCNAISISDKSIGQSIHGQYMPEFKDNKCIGRSISDKSIGQSVANAKNMPQFKDNKCMTKSISDKSIDDKFMTKSKNNKPMSKTKDNKSMADSISSKPVAQPKIKKSMLKLQSSKSVAQPKDKNSMFNLTSSKSMSPSMDKKGIANTISSTSIAQANDENCIYNLTSSKSMIKSKDNKCTTKSMSSKCPAQLKDKKSIAKSKSSKSMNQSKDNLNEDSFIECKCIAKSSNNSLDQSVVNKTTASCKPYRTISIFKIKSQVSMKDDSSMIACPCSSSMSCTDVKHATEVREKQKSPQIKPKQNKQTTNRREQCKFLRRLFKGKSNNKK